MFVVMTSCHVVAETFSRGARGETADDTMTASSPPKVSTASRRDRYNGPDRGCRRRSPFAPCGRGHLGQLLLAAPTMPTAAPGSLGSRSRGCARFPAEPPTTSRRPPERSIARSPCSLPAWYSADPLIVTARFENALAVRALREAPAMDTNDLILVSVDDHVVEPPDLSPPPPPSPLPLLPSSPLPLPSSSSSSLSFPSPSPLPPLPPLFFLPPPPPFSPPSLSLLSRPRVEGRPVRVRRRGREDDEDGGDDADDRARRRCRSAIRRWRSASSRAPTSCRRATRCCASRPPASAAPT